MRIVTTDNFDRSGEATGHDEHFLLWGMPEEDAKAICEILVRRMHDNSDTFFKVVENDYKLRKFEV